jgi:hypothetical protein
MDIEKLFEDYNNAINVEQSANKILELAKLEKEIAEEKLIYYMEVNNLTSIELDGKTVSLFVNIFPNVLVSNHDKLKELLGEDEKLVFTTKPSKLKSYFTKEFDKGNFIPSIVKLHFEKILKLKKPKKEK